MTAPPPTEHAARVASLERAHLDREAAGHRFLAVAAAMRAELAILRADAPSNS